VLVYACSLKNDAKLYTHNCRLKITLPPPLHHLHHLTTAETILHHPTPHYKHLTNNWPSDTILHHLHHLTTDGYIGHICRIRPTLYVHAFWSVNTLFSNVLFRLHSRRKTSYDHGWHLLYNTIQYNTVKMAVDNQKFKLFFEYIWVLPKQVSNSYSYPVATFSLE
jgi:hypothetical protein